jgi:hypothetical protein
LDEARQLVRVLEIAAENAATDCEEMHKNRKHIAAGYASGVITLLFPELFPEMQQDCRIQ